MQRQDQEGTAAAGLDDNGDELGVDGAEGAIPCDSGDADVIVALVVSHRLAEDVAELALSHNSPQHVCQRVPNRPSVSGCNMSHGHHVYTISFFFPSP